jgi:type IX secretion system PorP/SprF family membrane protein
MKRSTSIVMLFVAINCAGQDLHFSQIYNSALTLNPALTGLFIGDQRATINYKDQWRSIGNSFRTFAVSFDSGIFKKQMNHSYLGIGAHVFRDQAGDLNLANTRAQINLSGIVEVNRYQSLSAGVYVGYSQNSIDMTNAQWDSQYNGGQFDPNTASNETSFNSDTWGNADVGVGLAWYYESGTATLSSYDAFRLKIGLSANHLNRAELKYSTSFAAEPERQYMKYILHMNSFVGIKNTNTSLNPSFAVSMQGPAMEILLGTIYRIRVKEAAKYTGFVKEVAWGIGAHYRWNDAIIPAVFIEVDNFAVGISYDVNVSSLTTATNAQGGMEISIRFVNPNPFLYKRSVAVPSL